MSADAHGKPMSGASAHLIASSWTSANTFRRSLALNLTRMPAGDKCDGHRRAATCAAPPLFFQLFSFSAFTSHLFRISPRWACASS